MAFIPAKDVKRIRERRESGRKTRAEERQERFEEKERVTIVRAKEPGTVRTIEASGIETITKKGESIGEAGKVDIGRPSGSVGGRGDRPREVVSPTKEVETVEVLEKTAISPEERERVDRVQQFEDIQITPDTVTDVKEFERIVDTETAIPEPTEVQKSFTRPSRAELERNVISATPEPQTFREQLQRVRERSAEATITEDPIGVAKGIGAGIGTSLLDTGEFFSNLVTSPLETTKQTAVGLLNIPFMLPEIGERAGSVIKREPGFALGFGGTEVGSILLGSPERFSRTAARIDPRFVKVTEETATGEKLLKGLTKSGEDIKVVREGFTEPLTEQIKLAGKKDVLAVSGQRDLFGQLFRRDIPVDKPLPFEGASLLEKSFFADPRGRFRPKRAGIDQKTASLTDIIKGDFTFKRAKPQLVFFEGASIEKLPSSLLDVEKALKEGRTLTQAQEARLLEFQLKPSGEFKPVGFQSIESEITLAPGEILKSKGFFQRRKTIIDGKVVEIIPADIGKASPRTTELLQKQTLTTAEQGELLKRLGGETGLSTRISPKPLLSPTLPLQSTLAISKVIAQPKVSELKISSPTIEKRVSGGVTAPTISEPVITSPKPSVISPIKKPVGSIPIVSEPIIQQPRPQPPTFIDPRKTPVPRPPVPPIVKPPLPPDKKPPRKPRSDDRKKSDVQRPKSEITIIGGSEKKQFKRRFVGDLEETTRRAKTYVDNTPARRIKTPPLNPKERATVERILGKKFRRSKSQKNVYIEKEKYSIDSPGEKSGITLLGIRSERQNVRRRRL